MDDGIAGADVDSGCGDRLGRGNGLEFAGNGGGGGFVEVGNDDVRSALGGEKSDFAADAVASADDECDAPAEFLFRWLAANLGLFHSPVLNAEGLDGGEGDVV